MAVEDDEVRRWMADRYPDYADNLELGRLLYERGRKRDTRGARTVTGTGEIMPLEDLGARVRGMFRAVVGEVTVRQYEGCAVCKRKSCDDMMHNGQRKTWVVTSLRLYDRTASRWATYIGEEVLKVEAGDEVQVKGYGRSFRDDVELMIDEITVVMRRGVRMVVAEVRKAGKVASGLLNILCEDNGVTVGDVEQYLKKVVAADGGEWWVAR